MSASTKSSIESKFSEPEFLRLQAEQAKVGMSAALSDAGAALVRKVDPRKITGKHPIVTIVTAAVAGFVAALFAIPSKQEQELRRLERLQRAMHPQPPAQAAGNGKSEGHSPTEKRTIGAILIHEAIAMIKPILLASITAGIKSAAAPPPGPAADGHIPPTQSF